MKKYFSLNENFDNIIKNTLKDKQIKSIKPVTTGWTNIVFEVETNDGNYFFRFPRDDFWIRTIVKDCEFSNYIYKKTSYNTVLLKQFSNNNRAFSVHKKIEGASLTTKMNKLTPNEIQSVSYEIADFMAQLHNIKFNENDIFKVNNIGLNLVDFLNELVEKHLSQKDKIFWKYNEFEKKDSSCLVHGDLNPGNIILDNNNHISAIIDFGFAGYGNKYFDIARIIGRLPKEYKKEIIKSYEIITNEKLDLNRLNTEIEIWNSIDNGYKNYMHSVGIC